MVAESQVEKLRGAVAFRAIASQLRDGTPPGNPVAHPGLARLSEVLRALASDANARPSRSDLAVLVRQAMRYYEQQMAGTGVARLWVPSGPGWPDPDLWAQVGVAARIEGDGFILVARPWTPSWLANSGPDGVDAASAGERNMRVPDAVAGDPFLRRVPGHEIYRTRGQRSAVRAALCTPPGATLLVCLPTGDGKSLVFQLLACVGFGAPDGLPGVTLVVTPTVALAMDHQRAAEQLRIVSHRTAYVSGMPREERAQLTARIREGRQGLCFASPEAACGSLRESLLAAAESGLVRTIVVDEAHLVDAWGANFRASFQVLSGLRTELLRVSPPATRPRTLLLSATLTTATVETLRTLFPGSGVNGDGFGLVSAAQLRPEIEYWVAAPTTVRERASRVFEAIWHMPRPAILYVTEVARAQWWYTELRKLGFRRLGLMTGKSSDDERRVVIEDWRDRRLDLVVGTSAFGLGIDNPHVRTVIHACVPETLDRFYQEVGRGGRDGLSAASIIIPAVEQEPRLRDDYKTARVLNQRRLLTVEVGHRRWSAMFHHGEPEGDRVFRLRVDRPPGLETEYIDMVGERNTEWNVRALTLMANARMIELLGPSSNVARISPPDADEQREEDDQESAVSIERYQRVRIIEPRHLDLAVWHQLVGSERRRMEVAHEHNLERMTRYLQAIECAADTLAPVYHLELRGDQAGQVSTINVAKACGGCPDCRAKFRRRPTESAAIAAHPWPTANGLISPAIEMLDPSNRIVIFYPDVLDARTLRRWADALGKLVTCGVRNLIALQGAPVDAITVQAKVPNIALFAAESLAPRDYLPDGPAMVILPQGHPISERLLRSRPPTEAHFLFVPGDTEYPNMPGVLLRKRFAGPQMASLDLFIQRMVK